MGLKLSQRQWHVSGRVTLSTLKIEEAAKDIDETKRVSKRCERTADLNV